jgi:hypothetical protein
MSDQADREDAAKEDLAEWREMIADKNLHRDEEADRLRDEVGRAIGAFLSHVSEGEYISNGWVVGVDVTSTRMAKAGSSWVACITPSLPQSAAHTRGIAENVVEGF